MKASSRPQQTKRLRSLPGENTGKLTPFLKWAGGKSQLLLQYDNYFPSEFKRYFEPFTGGAAVFFHLRNKFGGNFDASLSDLNHELINCYAMVRDQVDCLIDMLSLHINDESYFYKIRSQNSEQLSDLDRAARFIYLNKTCFNGLYRVNSRGLFNVPYGFYKNPAICNEALLRSCSSALQGTKLSCNSFESLLSKARKGDFVYFDPPYHPLSETANFTSYTKNSFSSQDQIRLAETYKTLHQRGCKLLLSNSNTGFIADLYKDFEIETVFAMRAINCKAEGRGKITEILVRNY